MGEGGANVKSSADVLCADSKTDNVVFNPRLGLGSTDNENIAFRRNHRELELLIRKQKILGQEQEYVIKMIELSSKSAQVRYKRLTKRVGRIRSHLTEEEIKEMENDVRKAEFANKYRNLLRGDQQEPDYNIDESAFHCEGNEGDTYEAARRLSTVHEDEQTGIRSSSPEIRESQSLFAQEPTKHKVAENRPKTTQCRGNDAGDKDAVEEIIPSLEGLLDQLHNIKPHQFYDNQRKLKLYDIQLSLEELEGKKKTFYKGVDAIVNWNKKKEEKKEEEKDPEEEKPRKRKTTFMRSVLRNFSMELMMKTRQYGWTDLGKCSYLRSRNDNDDGGGTIPLAKDSLKLRLPDAEPDENPQPVRPRVEPGFTADGKMIRTADLLGLKY